MTDLILHHQAMADLWVDHSCAPCDVSADSTPQRSGGHSQAHHMQKLLKLVSNQSLSLGSTYASRQYGYTCVFGGSWVV